MTTNNADLWIKIAQVFKRQKMIWGKNTEQHVLNGGWRTRLVRTRSEQQPVQQRRRTQRGGGEAWRGAPAPSPHQADKPGNEKSEVGEASRGRGGVCVCGQEEVSGCLDGCIGGGAAGKSEEPQCTCITTTWPPLPPLPSPLFPATSFCVQCSSKYNENTEWCLCTILSFSSVASLRKLHSGYFDETTTHFLLLSILRLDGSHQKVSKQEKGAMNYSKI